MAALPAVLLSWKFRSPLFVMVALAAELLPAKAIDPPLVMLVMPLVSALMTLNALVVNDIDGTDDLAGHAGRAELQRAVADGGTAGIAIGAGERQRSGARFGQAAGAASDWLTVKPAASAMSAYRLPRPN